MRAARIIAVAAVCTSALAHAAPHPFTCKDLTAKKVKSWHGTIAITFKSTSANRGGLSYGGTASYTLRYSNDLLRGSFVIWPGFTDGWLGETKTGSATYRAEVSGFVVESDGPLLHPAPGNWDGLGIDPFDQIQVDAAGCRYTLHAGVATRSKGDAERAGFSSAGGPPGQPVPDPPVGFSGSIPIQKIPASATELAGSATIGIPGSRFDMVNSFYYTCRTDDCSRAVGSATISWNLVPEFEPEVEIEAAQLLDVDNGPLQFLSASPCSAALCNGNPRVHGTIAIRGKPDDAPAEISLEVLDASGALITTASLAEDVRATLLRGFGPSRRVAITSPRRLFQFSDEQLVHVEQNRDARLHLRILVRTAKKAEARRDMMSVPKLVRYTRANRNPSFGPDANRGGDSWIKPSVRDVYEAMGNDFIWSDFSNMNGGRFFPPHTSHTSGNDVDGVFSDGSIERDWAQLKHHTAATAQRLLAQLENPVYGSRIICVFLYFDRANPSDPFWGAIRNVTLRDGRRAAGVFLSIPKVTDHETHFHFRVTDAADARPYKECPKYIVDGVP